jgi:hypothetical protein
MEANLSGDVLGDALSIGSQTIGFDEVAALSLGVVRLGTNVRRHAANGFGGTGIHLGAPRSISAGDEVASSAAQGARLNEHLRLSERYGAGGVRELADGRIRYYGELTPAAKPGDMAGARLVREWNAAANRHRTWYETIDHAGRVRQVHPYTPYSEHHYWFDEFGNYGGRR